MIERRQTNSVASPKEPRTKVTKNGTAKTGGVKKVARKSSSSVPSPSKQGLEDGYKVGYKNPPRNRQFGQPEGNPRHNGSWKKEDTLRFKLERLIPMSNMELKAVVADSDEGEIVKQTAKLILNMGRMKPQERWKTIQDMINQTCGFPKISAEQTVLEPPAPLSPRRAARREAK